MKVLTPHACLLAIGVVSCAGCEIDSQGDGPLTISALQWTAKDVESGESIAEGCTAGTPEVRVAPGQRIELRLEYEAVKRPAGMSSDPCSTAQDLSRKPATKVLALRCRTDLVTTTAAALVSLESVPPGAPEVDDHWAEASGYSYVLDVKGTGLVRQQLDPSCDQAYDRVPVVEILAPEG
jgi:hypothetical protein